MNAPYFGFQSLVNPTGERGSFNQAEFDKLPDWLRAQYTFRPGDSEGSNAAGWWEAPGQFLNNAQGQRVFQLGPDGSTLQNGYSLKDPDAWRDDPDLGRVTDASNLDSSAWDARHRRAGQIAAGIMAAGTAAGMMGIGGAGASPFAGATAEGAISGGAAGGLGGGSVVVPGLLGPETLGLTIPEMLPAANVGGGLLSTIGSAITGDPLGAARLGMGAAGLLGGALGGGGGGGGGGGLLGGPAGGLSVKNPTYQPNLQTQRQLDDLYGGNMSGQPSYGGGQSYGAKPMQATGYGGGGAQTFNQMPMQIPQGQNNLYMPMQIPQGQNNLYGGGQAGMGGGQTYGTKPMMLGGQDGGQTYGTKPMMLGGGGDFGPLPPPTNPPGDFGPLPPPGGGAGNFNILSPEGQAQMAALRGRFQQQMQRPTINDPNIDQSVRNSAIGDGFSGLRNGFLYGGGQRLMPTTGNAQQDQATLRQFGIRPPTFGPGYGF